MLNENAPEVSRARWWVMAGLAAFALFSYMARTNISVAAELMMPGLGLTRMQMGHLFTSFLIGYAVFQIPGGWIGDRLGGRLTLGLSALVWALATLLTGLLPSLLVARPRLLFLALWIVRFVLGMSEATTFPVGNRVVRNWMPPRQRALGNSIMFLGTSLASAMTAPMVSSIMLRFGWPASFYVTAVLTFIAAVVWIWRSRDHPAHVHARTQPLASTALLPPQRGPLLRNRNVWLLTISYVSEGYVLFIFVFWLYIYLVEKRGFTLLRGGWIAAIPWLVAMLLTPLGGVVCDRIAMHRGRLTGARTVIIVGYLLSGGLLFAAAWAGSRTIAVAALSISIAALMTSESSFWSSASYLAGANVGLLSGVMNTVGILGGIASTLLVPFLVQRFGWMPALATGSVMALFCSVLWVGVREADFADTRG